MELLLAEAALPLSYRGWRREADLNRRPTITHELRPTEIGQEAGICTRTVAFTTRSAALTPQSCWSPWSDSHRRIRVYETRPVAAVGTGANGVHGRNCTCDLHLRKVALWISLSYADRMASVAGLAPARTGLKGRTLGLLCIHGPNGHWSRDCADTSGFSDRRAD